MKEFIVQNSELIFTIVTMIVTGICGVITKKHTKIKNKLIPVQNIIIACIMSIVYYFATGNLSMVVATGSPIMTLLYDTVHSLKEG